MLHEWSLPLFLRVKQPQFDNPSPATHYEYGPVDPTYPGRWYVPCCKIEHVSKHIVGGDSGTMRYKLPDNVECKHCVLQWYWDTANSCTPRGFLEYFEAFNNPFGTECDGHGGAKGGYWAGMAACEGMSISGEFWTCSDVQMTKGGESRGRVRTVGHREGSNAEVTAETPPPLACPVAADRVEPEGGENPSPSVSPFMDHSVQAPSPSVSPVMQNDVDAEETRVTPSPSMSPVDEGGWGKIPGPLRREAPPAIESVSKTRRFVTGRSIAAAPTMYACTAARGTVYVSRLARVVECRADQGWLNITSC